MESINSKVNPKLFLSIAVIASIIIFLVANRPEKVEQVVLLGTENDEKNTIRRVKEIFKKKLPVLIKK